MRATPPRPGHRRLRAAATLAGALAAAGALGLGPARLAAEDATEPASPWPLVVEAAGAELRIERPRADALEGDRLSSHAVFSRAPLGADGQPGERDFGVLWLSARADIDRDERTLTLSDQEVSRVGLAGAAAADASASAQAITEVLRARRPVLSLDRVLAALARHQAAVAQSARIATDPPAILVSHVPAVLVRIDGEPQEEPIPGARFARVMNTPFMVAHDDDTGAYWILHDERWYAAGAIGGPWTSVALPPAPVAALGPALAGYTPAAAPSADPAPSIVVSTAPAELIGFAGDPAWEAVPGGQLLAAANCDRDVFRDPASGLDYVLLSGRWYAAADLDHGPWRYVGPDQLPPDFARIPADSRWSDILVHVAGTTEAAEAALDSRLPQTAAIPRDATTTVSYDGDPAWQQIPGTPLAYAMNCDQEVISGPNGACSCCDQGVWYSAPGPLGPWTVASATPADLGDIPPDCPVYNCRYVQVFECTADTCYVGYTAGYAGSYVVAGCLVWGTGYRYDPWWHHHYHPRPWTWGMGMSYDPWTCHWGTDVEASAGGIAGWWAFGRRGAEGRWWGPCGYRPVYLHAPRPSEDMIARQRARIPERERERFDLDAQRSLYRGRERVRTPAPAAARAPEPAHPSAPAPGPRAPILRQPEREPHYATPDGGVWRHSDQGWERWQGKAWEGAPAHGPAEAPPEPRAPAPRPTEPRQPILRAPEPSPWSASTRQELEHAAAADQRGERRVQGFQQQRASTAPVRRPIQRDDHPGR